MLEVAALRTMSRARTSPGEGVALLLEYEPSSPLTESNQLRAFCVVAEWLQNENSGLVWLSPRYANTRTIGQCRSASDVATRRTPTHRATYQAGSTMAGKDAGLISMRGSGVVGTGQQEQRATPPRNASASTQLDQHRSHVPNSVASYPPLHGRLHHLAPSYRPPIPYTHTHTIIHTHTHTHTHTHSRNRRGPHTLSDSNALDDDPSIPYIDTVRRLRSSVFTDGSEDPSSSSSSSSSLGPSFHPIGGAPAASSAAPSTGTAAGSSSSSVSAVSPTTGSATSSSTGYEDDIAREVNKAEARYNVVERPNDWIKSATRKMAK